MDRLCVIILMTVLFLTFICSIFCLHTCTDVLLIFTHSKLRHHGNWRFLYYVIDIIVVDSSEILAQSLKSRNYIGRKYNGVYNVRI